MRHHGAVINKINKATDLCNNMKLSPSYIVKWGKKAN